MIITNNSPIAGSIAWQDVVIKHKNVTYTVTNGNSALKFIWWDFTTPAALQASASQPVMDDNDALLFINRSGTHRIVWTNLVDGAAVIDATLIVTGQFIFTYAELCALGINVTLELFAATPLTLVEVFISVKTAPTGASLIVDVNKNGVTIFTNQANRPAILAGATSATSGVPDITTIVKNDKLTIDIDQIGSVLPGEDLTVHVRFSQPHTS